MKSALALVFAILAGAAAASTFWHRVYSGRVVIRPVIAVAEQLCARNEGLRQIEQHLRRDHFDVRCANGALFQDLFMDFKEKAGETP